MNFRKRRITVYESLPPVITFDKKITPREPLIITEIKPQKIFDPQRVFKKRFGRQTKNDGF